MTARTALTSGHPSFPYRDLALAARRNLTRGLAASALAHFALLAALVASQDPEAPLRLVKGSVELVPNPPVFVPPAARPIPPDMEAPPIVAEGDLVPVERPRFDPPKMPIRNGQTGNVREGGAPSGPLPGSEQGRSGVVDPPEPAEHGFVFFDEPPVPVHRPDPAYPGWARENGISGTVVLRVLVDREGTVRRVSVVRGVTGLTEAAQEALFRWIFRPARANRQPVMVWVEIPVSFRLGE
jgi:TonB family protein